MVECPTCGREDFNSKGGMRRHHTKIHDERLPNSTCAFCGDEWYDERSDRKRCSDCPDNIEPPPDYFGGTIREWKSKSPYQRWYVKNSEDEKERVHQRRVKLREWLANLKDDIECAQCGETRNPALDFHHEGEKELGIARMIGNGWSRENILAEIDRCEVLCANCHRVKHA